MTAREALMMLEAANWGSCEEIAAPRMMAFVRGFLAEDPDAPTYAKLFLPEAAGGRHPVDDRLIHDFERKHGG